MDLMGIYIYIYIYIIYIYIYIYLNLADTKLFLSFNKKNKDQSFHSVSK